MHFWTLVHFVPRFDAVIKHTHQRFIARTWNTEDFRYESWQFVGRQEAQKNGEKWVSFNASFNPPCQFFQGFLLFWPSLIFICRKNNNSKLVSQRTLFVHWLSTQTSCKCAYACECDIRKRCCVSTCTLQMSTCMFQLPTCNFAKNPMSTSWQILVWHFKTSTWHFKTSTWYFKTPNMTFQNSEHGVSLGAGHAPATTLWRARASANGCFD